MEHRLGRRRAAKSYAFRTMLQVGGASVSVSAALLPGSR